MTIEKKRLKSSIIIAVCVVLVLIIITIISNVGNNYDYKNNTYIFNTIDDLNFLNNKVIANNVQDNKLGNLTYQSSRTIQVEYEGKTYNLFAYEFNSKDDAFAYGETVTGNNYQYAYEKYGNVGWYNSKYFALIIIPISCKLLVLNGNNVLVVESKTSKKQFNKFIDYLFTNLPQKVDVLI